jgi:hypothetical protein
MACPAFKTAALLARPVLLPIIRPPVTAGGWASAGVEACKWSVRLSYLSARDIARLGPATQGIMVAHSVRNAKVFFSSGGRLFFLLKRACASEIASFSGSPLFLP